MESKSSNGTFSLLNNQLLYIPDFTPATFGFENQQSYIQYTIPEDQKAELQDHVDMSMFFRTRKADGLIFYLGSDPAEAELTYLNAYVENGELIVRMSSIFFSKKLIQWKETTQFVQVSRTIF